DLYNSLQASLDKRFAGGLQFQAAYTWSKSIDQASSFEGILNPVDPRRSRGLSQFDARHRFVLSYYWEPPLPKYQGAAGKLINGWALSGITSFQSGFPIRILSSADNELMNSFDFELPGEPDQLKPFRTQDPRTQRSIHRCLAESATLREPFVVGRGSTIGTSRCTKIPALPRTPILSSGLSSSMLSITRSS